MRFSMMMAAGWLCLLLSVGCVKTDNTASTANSGGDNSNNSNNANSESANTSGGDVKKQADTQGMATSPDKGNFTVLYQDPQSQKYVEMNENYKKQRLLEDTADELNASVSIPENVAITFKECGQVNAYWNPRDRQIVMCFEFIEDTATKFRQVVKDQKEYEDAVGGAITFAFIHEVGHCLIDVLNLPATGREEDSVDQLATYVLIDSGDDGEKMALNGARMWGLWFNEKGGTSQTASDINWADEHSLDAQRFFNIICWVFGHNPDKWRGLIDDPLPENRAVRCPTEYVKMSKAWTHLLTPYMKRGTKNTEAVTSAADQTGGTPTNTAPDGGGHTAPGTH
jgi:hypothetical protein